MSDFLLTAVSKMKLSVYFVSLTKDVGDSLP